MRACVRVWGNCHWCQYLSCSWLGKLHNCIFSHCGRLLSQHASGYDVEFAVLGIPASLSLVALIGENLVVVVRHIVWTGTAKQACVRQHEQRISRETENRFEYISSGTMTGNRFIVLLVKFATCLTAMRELACHMGSHNVTCHPADMAFPPLSQPIKAGTRISVLGRCKAELT